MRTAISVNASTHFHWFPSFWYVFSGWKWNQAKPLNVCLQLRERSVGTWGICFSWLISGNNLEQRKCRCKFCSAWLRKEVFSSDHCWKEMVLDILIKITTYKTTSCSSYKHLCLPWLYFIFRGRNIPLVLRVSECRTTVHVSVSLASPCI